MSVIQYLVIFLRCNYEMLKKSFVNTLLIIFLKFAIFCHNIFKLQKSYPKDHPRTLIPELCKLFYSNGWVTGTGGGISIKYKYAIIIKYLFH